MVDNKLYDSKNKGALVGQQTFLKPHKQRGGKRANAGRKSTRGSTSVMRIPDSYKDVIKAVCTMFDNIDWTTGKGEVEIERKNGNVRVKVESDCFGWYDDGL